MSDAQVTFRTSRGDIDRANRTLARMRKLPEYELLDVSQGEVLRLALSKGAELVGDARPECFTLPAAKKLATAASAGVNPLNVMLTQGSEANYLFASGVVQILEGKADDAQDAQVTIRIPASVREQIEAVRPRLTLQKGLDTTSALLRLALRVGLFMLDAEVYWAERALERAQREAKRAGLTVDQYRRRSGLVRTKIPKGSRPTETQRKEIDRMLERLASDCAPAITLRWDWRDAEQDLWITGSRTVDHWELTSGTGKYQGEIAQAPDPIKAVERMAREVIKRAKESAAA